MKTENLIRLITATAHHSLLLLSFTAHTRRVSTVVKTSV